MKALVTGGGGFLGLALVRALRQRGLAVRSISRQRYEVLTKLGVEQVRGDLVELAAVMAAVQGCDVVYHVAAKAGIWGPYEEYHRANVVGTENVIAACRRQGVARLVYTSSPSVVFDGGDMEGVNESVPYPAHFEAAYPQTKALAEQRILAANGPNLSTVALRPHLIWGPGDHHLLPRLVARSRAGQLRRIGRGKNKVDTVYIDNAVEAHLQAADALRPGAAAAGRAYFIANGEPVELWEMVNRLLAAAGEPPVQRAVPLRLALALAWVFETSARLRRQQAEPRLTRFVVREMATAHWFDLSAARRDFGYVPRVNVAEGLQLLQTHLQKTAGSRQV